MNNRKLKRKKHQQQVMAAWRYLDGVTARISPTEALLRVMHLRAYRAEYNRIGCDLPF